MVATVRITTTVDPDGVVRLSEREIRLAGIRPGDRVHVAIVRDVEPAAAPDIAPRDAEFPPEMPFEEWLDRFRADFPLPDGDVDVEELIRQGEDDVAREFWERFDRRD